MLYSTCKVFFTRLVFHVKKLSLFFTCFGNHVKLALHVVAIMQRNPPLSLHVWLRSRARSLRTFAVHTIAHHQL